jgi:hypothetical protein
MNNLELEQYKQAERERQRHEARRERQEAFKNWKCTAETWPEALAKQAVLMAEEATQWSSELENEFPDDYFRPGADACTRAGEIWREVETSKAEKIADLKRQLEAIQDEIRMAVATRLYDESDMPGWKSVAEAIEEDVDLNNWLDW